MEDIKKIKEIIEKHQHWLRKDCDKCENMRANLYEVDLRGADLREINLRFADLRGANLRGADLRRIDLCGADLRGTNLCGADLRGANLYRANFYRADLHKANLSETNLCEANLCGANLCRVDLYNAILSEANLCGADLYKAILSEANLCGANLCGVDLYKANLNEANLNEADLCGADLCGAILNGANLCRANNIPFIPYACPDFGAFVGFKKAHGLIVMLEIPKDARRLSAAGKKCRCDKAKVIDIQNIDGTKANVTSISSDKDNNFIYKIGEEVCVSDFDENRWNECSTGIHFFINRQEAVNYGS